MTDRMVLPINPIGFIRRYCQAIQRLRSLIFLSINEVFPLQSLQYRRYHEMHGMRTTRSLRLLFTWTILSRAESGHAKWHLTGLGVNNFISLLYVPPPPPLLRTLINYIPYCVYLLWAALIGNPYIGNTGAKHENICTDHVGLETFWSN